MTKKELEEKNKALRAELDKAHAELKELQGEKKLLGELDDRAIGGYYDKEAKQWVVAKLHFNRETGEAEVKESKKVGIDLAFFMHAVNEFIAEEINLRSMR